MRIIAGQNRGLRLAEIGQGDHAAHLRPTTDRVRETLFNILRNWVDFQDLKVLDLFAGTGALGLEALSRGAQHVTFVENGRVGQKLIGDNIARMRAQDRCKLIAQDATKMPPGVPCDLVFLDPPYGKSLGHQALRSAWAQGWIAAEAWIVFEEASAMTPEGFVLRDSRKFGGTTMTFLQPIQEAAVSEPGKGEG